MFGNFSLPEILVVAALALIVIGPKDLPRMMRQVGRFVGQARGLARQFQDSMNDAAREADLDEFREARRLLKGGKSGVTDMLNETLDVDGDDEKPAKPKKNPVLSSDEMKQRADESGFGAVEGPGDEPVMQPLAAASPPTATPPATPLPASPPTNDDTARTADAKSG